MFDYQVVINGLIASDAPYTDEYGVEWIVTELKGWGAVQSTRENIQHTRAMGAFSSLGYARSRNLSISGEFIAPDSTYASDAIDRLNNAVSLTKFPLYVLEGDVVRYVWAYRSDEVIVSWRNKRAVSWSLGLVADDPRKFHPQISGSTGLPSSVGGLTFPLTVPFSISGTQVTGQVSLTNPGNENGPVLIRINGPIVAPVITHVNSGRSLVFSSSLELAEGEWIDIDMDKQAVLAQGQASRATYVTSRQWSSFVPGINTWAFTAEEYEADAAMIVYATPADK